MFQNNYQSMNAEEMSLGQTLSRIKKGYSQADLDQVVHHHNFKEIFYEMKLLDLRDESRALKAEFLCHAYFKKMEQQVPAIDLLKKTYSGTAQQFIDATKEQDDLQRVLLVQDLEEPVQELGLEELYSQEMLEDAVHKACKKPLWQRVLGM